MLKDNNYIFQDLKAFQDGLATEMSRLACSDDSFCTVRVDEPVCVRDEVSNNLHIVKVQTSISMYMKQVYLHTLVSAKLGQLFDLKRSRCFSESVPTDDLFDVS